MPFKASITLRLPVIPLPSALLVLEEEDAGVGVEAEAVVEAAEPLMVVLETVLKEEEVVEVVVEEDVEEVVVEDVEVIEGAEVVDEEAVEVSKGDHRKRD